MLRRVGSVVLFAILATLSPALQAAENPLDAISPDAGIVLRLKAPATTTEKVADLVDQVVPGFGDQVRAQADGIGMLISNPTLAGVDKSADWWVAVYPRGGEQEPGVVFIIPASDLKAMKEGLGESFKFLEFGKYGVYTSDADTADKVAPRLKGEGKSIAGLVDKDSTTVFDKGELSVFLNVTRLVSVYRNEINELKEKLAQQLENVPTQAGGAPGLNPKLIADMLGELLQLVLQGLDDTQTCTISAIISKEGLAFEDLVRVASGSATDKLLQKSPPSAISVLNTLPAGALGYLGLQGDFKELMQFSLKLSGAFLGDNEAAGKELQTALTEMQSLKYGAIASSFSVGSLEEGAIRSTSVTEVDSPTKLRGISQKLFKALAGVNTAGVKQNYDLKIDAEKFGQNSADVLTVTTESTDATDPAQADMIDRLMKALYGPNGMVSRMVYLKDKLVQSNGGGKEAMSQLLAALEKKGATTGDHEGYKASRGKLGEKANLVVLFDLPRFIANALEQVAESGLLPPVLPLNAEMFRSLDLKPTYLGISLATEPQALRAKTLIPTAQMQGIAKLVDTFRALQQGN